MWLSDYRHLFFCMCKSKQMVSVEDVLSTGLEVTLFIVVERARVGVLLLWWRASLCLPVLQEGYREKKKNKTDSEQGGES